MTVPFPPRDIEPWDTLLQVYIDGQDTAVSDLVTAERVRALTAEAAIIVGAGGLAATNNLSDVANVATARTNLGLGNAAVRNMGNTNADVAAGDDASSQISSLKSSYLGTAAQSDATDFDPAGAATDAVNSMPTVQFDHTQIPDDPTVVADFQTQGNVTVLRGGLLGTTSGAGLLSAAANLSDVVSAPTALTNLGAAPATLAFDNTVPAGQIIYGSSTKTGLAAGNSTAPIKLEAATSATINADTTDYNVGLFLNNWTADGAALVIGNRAAGDGIYLQASDTSLAQTIHPYALNIDAGTSALQTTVTGTATATGTTSLTDGSKTWTTNQWAGRYVCTPDNSTPSTTVRGYILSNTATVLTILAWTQSTGASGVSQQTAATPASNTGYVIDNSYADGIHLRRYSKGRGVQIVGSTGSGNNGTSDELLLVDLNSDAGTNAKIQLWSKGGSTLGYFNQNGEFRAKFFTLSGNTGATAAGRWMGTTASGAPTTGTYATGDWITTQNAHVFLCTAGGTPGTWADVTASVTTTSLGAVPTARQVIAGTGLTGGGDLSADRTLSFATIGANTLLGSIAGGTPTALTATQGLTLLGAEATANKGIQSGYAPFTTSAAIGQARIPPPARMALPMRTFRLALANRANFPVKEMILGDSLETLWISDPENVAYPALYEKAMALRYNTYPRSAGMMVVDAPAASIYPRGVHWDTVQGTQTGTTGPSGHGYTLTSGQHCDVSRLGDAVTIYYTAQRTGGDTATVTIGGTTVGTINSTDSTVASSPGFDCGRSVTFANPNGYTTMAVVVTDTSGSGTFLLDACYIHASNSTSGYLTQRVAHGGWGMTDFLDPSFPNMLQFVANQLPQVVTIELGVNDAAPTNHNVIASAFGPLITSMIAAIRACYGPRTGVTSDVTANTFTLPTRSYPNGTQVIFSGLTNTTGTGVSNGKPFWVVGSSGSTFQIAATFGGSAIDLTGSNDTNLSVSSPLPCIRYIFEQDVDPGGICPVNWKTDWRAAARAAIEADGNCVWIDWYEALGTYVTGANGDVYSIAPGDEVHPGDTGHYVLASALIDATVVGLAERSVLTSPTFLNTSTFNDGNPAHGSITLGAGALGPILSMYKNTADTAAIVSLGTDLLALGPGGSSATDVRLTRTGAGTATVLGTLTIPAPTLTGTVSATGGGVEVTDGTAGHGQVELAVSGFGPGINIYKTAGDTTAWASLLPTGISTGPGGNGNAHDFKVLRTGTAAGAVTGVLTMTSPVINTGVSGTAIDTDSTFATGAATTVTASSAVKTALALKAPLAGPTFTGTVASTGGLLNLTSTVTNATGGITGSVSNLSTATLTTLGIQHTAGDVQPVIYMLDANGVGSLNLGGGVTGADVKLTRTGAGTATVLGTLTIPSPTVSGHATIEGVTATGATGTGKFVFDGTPTLVTPVIGAATGTSLALSGNIGFNGKALQALTGIAAPTATALRTAAPNATYSTTGATGVATGGFDSNTHRDNVITDLANTMQRLGALIIDLRANGVIG